MWAKWGNGGVLEGVVVGLRNRMRFDSDVFLELVKKNIYSFN